jgi:hypothetical protein
VARPGHERFDLRVRTTDPVVWARFAEFVSAQYPGPKAKAVIRVSGSWPSTPRHANTSPSPIWDSPQLSRNWFTDLTTWNVRGLKSSLPETSSWLHRHRPSVLALQETFISANFNNVTLPGYTYYGTPAGGLRALKGGTALPVRADIARFCTLTLVIPGTQVWITCAPPGGVVTIVGSVYRPPEATSAWWNDLTNTVTHFKTLSLDRVIAMGDFNAQSKALWAAYGQARYCSR